MVAMTLPQRSFRILGIDPGTHVLGWGVVERSGSRLVALGFGVVRARACAPVEERLATIAKGLRDVVAIHRPDEAAIEDVFYGRDVRAAVRIGEGRGAALVVAADAGLSVTSYANNVVKRAVAGAGRAAKESVHRMVLAVLGLASLEGPLDASDALALAICHHHRRGVGVATPALPARGRARTAATWAPSVRAAIAAARGSGRAPASGRMLRPGRAPR